MTKSVVAFTTGTDMNVTYTLTDNHITQLHALYQQEWWTKGRSIEATRQGIRGSQICIGIVSDTDELVGFTRVITDYVFKAFVFDVIVRQDARCLGLGKQLVALVTTHPKLKSVRHIELYCQPELVPFYEKRGFSSDVGGFQLMRFEPLTKPA